MRDQISDNFSFNKGTHSFKTGIDLNFITDKVRSSVNSAGLYTYSSAVALPTAVGCPTSGSGLIFCDWLVDLYGANVGDSKTRAHYTTYTQIVDTRGVSYQFAPGFAPPQGFVPPRTYEEIINASDESGYFQDTWKARPNVTVNLGLRYDVELFPTPPYPNNSTPFLASYTDKFPTDYSGFQPRVGVAWNLAKNTVVRAGGGIFYGTTNVGVFKTIVNGGDNAQVNCTPANCPTGLVYPDVVFNVQNVPLQSPFTSPTLTAAQQPLVPVAVNPTVSPCPCGNRGINPADRRPRAYEVEAGVEHQLPWNMSISATYDFTRGVQLPFTNDANIAPTNLTKTYDVVNASGATVLQSTVPFYTTRIDPTAAAVVTQHGGVNSTYNAMVLTLRKAPSHGIELLFNYTLSKATDDGQQSGISSAAGGETFFGTYGSVDPYNQKLEQGFSSTDVPNRVTASVVWTPTYAKSAGRLVRGLADGWSLGGSYTFSNGTHYAGMVSSTASSCLVVATVCPAGDSGLNGGMSGSDISTTANSLGGRIAWVPNNFYELPSFTDVDLRLARRFTIRERYSLEFRAEAFNLFNSDIVQGVNQNAFTYATPAATSTTCPSALHSNTCMIPVSTFQAPTTTSGVLLGARQLQFALRFEF